MKTTVALAAVVFLCARNTGNPDLSERQLAGMRYPAERCIRTLLSAPAQPLRLLAQRFHTHGGTCVYDFRPRASKMLLCDNGGIHDNDRGLPSRA